MIITMPSLLNGSSIKSNCGRKRAASQDSSKSKKAMYGGFILTTKGVKLVEYNARFGDPEAMNVLPILKTDFVGICQAIITQELSRVKVEFEKKATVCKYVVPLGYPGKPSKNEKIEINKIRNDAKMYYASVEQKDDGIYMTGSRAVAFIGIGKNVGEAEKIAEEAVSQVKGRVFHRKDIGTKVLIQKRIIFSYTEVGILRTTPRLPYESK